MNVWLPLIRSGGGAEVLTESLRDRLNANGCNAEISLAPHFLQYLPWVERSRTPPPNTRLIATHSWYGPAYHRPGIPLVAIEHLFTPGNSLQAYRSVAQNIFHNTLVRNFVNYSYQHAAMTVAVSDFTRNQILDFRPATRVQRIYNGTDLDFFSPVIKRQARPTGKPVNLLFVGNLITRKGIDLLPAIMQALGDNYQLNFTQGLRTRGLLHEIPNGHCLGRLDRTQMREAYRNADMLLFPSRMEGHPLAIIEAAACGLPAIASDASSMPEAVIDGETGKLCQVDDVASFVNAIRQLADNPAELMRMSDNCRTLAQQRFNANTMAASYRELFEKILDQPS